MSGRTTIKWRGDQFLNALPGAIDAGLTAAAARLADQAVRSFGRDHGGVPSAPGSPPNSQRGSLRNSVGFAAGRGGRAYVGTGLAYGRHLEFGAVSRPRRAKMLAIPLNKAAKSALRRFDSARAAIEAARREGKRIVRIPAKRGIVVGIAPKKRPLTDSHPKWFLTDQAIIRPRPWLRPAMVAARPAMREAFIDAARKRLKAVASQ